MASQERYFLGPGLRDKIRDVIIRVDGTALAGQRQESPTRIQETRRPILEIRAAQFTGSWSLGVTKAVDFSAEPSGTAAVRNVIAYLPFTHSQNCIIGKEGTSWHLISAVQQHVKQGSCQAPWNKYANATVTLFNGVTVSAYNHYATISGTGTKQCTVAMDGVSGGWHLIAAECS